MAVVSDPNRGWRIAPVCYIYIYIYIYTQNSIFGESILERSLDRFWRGFWIDFREVFGEVLERFLEIILILWASKIPLQNLSKTSPTSLQKSPQIETSKS